MAKTHIAFDTRTGQILGAYPGLDDPKEAVQSMHRYVKQHRVQVEPDHIDVIAVSAEPFEQGKLYKVDLKHRTLTPVSGTEGGASFGFGPSTPRPY